MDEVRWRRPVRPGDVLSARYTVQEKRVLASRPDVGIAKVLVELVDANGEVPCTWHTNQLTRVRHPAVAAPAGAARKPQAKKAPPVDLWEGPAAPRGADPYYEDVVLGETYEIGSHTFTREEIIAFAQEYDPQPFHLDEAAAKASLFGALCASGWLTAAHCIRFIVTSRREVNAGALAGGLTLPIYGPSPGFRDLSWPKPVYVGDTITYRTRPIEKIDMRTRPNRGLLASAVQARNQNGEIVFAVTSLILVDRRKPLAGI
jgi:acyl dehydratase